MQRLNRLRIGGALIGAALCVSACGDGEGDTSGGAGTMNNGATFPKPEVAGTPETNALAEAPAQCGQPAYTWLKSADLGRVTAHEPQAVYTKSLLETLLIASGI